LCQQNTPGATAFTSDRLKAIDLACLGKGLAYNNEQRVLSAGPGRLNCVICPVLTIRPQQQSCLSYSPLEGRIVTEARAHDACNFIMRQLRQNPYPEQMPDFAGWGGVEPLQMLMLTIALRRND
jgi:hypothetical protein